MNIHIEGNIGTGKSTFIDFISKHFDCCTSPEPVKEWEELTDSDGGNIIQKFYEDIPRWSFAFQMNCFISRTHQTKSLPTGKSKFIERSIHSDKIFAKNCFDRGEMNLIEYKIYEKWSKWLETKLCDKIDAIIYLRSSPEVCYERIKNRSRKGEESIPIEYLQELHIHHEEWLEKTDIPVYVIDSDNLSYDDPGLVDFILDNFININQS